MLICYGSIAYQFKNRSVSADIVLHSFAYILKIIKGIVNYSSLIIYRLFCLLLHLLCETVARLGISDW